MVAERSLKFEKVDPELTIPTEIEEILEQKESDLKLSGNSPPPGSTNGP